MFPSWSSSWPSACEVPLRAPSDDSVVSYNPVMPVASGVSKTIESSLGAAVVPVAASPVSCPSSCAPLSEDRLGSLDRKSTRLNSSHANISYAVFCLKKKQIPSTHYFSTEHRLSELAAA